MIYRCSIQRSGDNTPCTGHLWEREPSPTPFRLQFEDLHTKLLVLNLFLDNGFNVAVVAILDTLVLISVAIELHM
ncbi:hypothetical protein L1987_77386 [Smallanthus sonchifolius]|uniref:Uncharacterized protein n=1 Tax=Smallanthus sonchifolius TaxID=185202 RepID=A0ACB8ZAQ1_9ASTR|nr:hypothetical protein L1987_77386 [Smallanthus sonchifolius]